MPNKGMAHKEEMGLCGSGKKPAPKKPAPKKKPAKK